MSRAPSPTGLGPAGHQRVPDGRSGVGPDQQLHAVLARVPGPADERPGAGDRALAAVHPRWQLTVGELADERARSRTLHGEHRELGLPIDHVDVEIVGVTLEPGQVLVVVGGVGDGQELALGQAVGEEVVEHAAVVAAEDAVLGAAFGDPADVVGQQMLEELERGRSARLDLAHVRDVEHADALPDGEVLVADPGVLDRHLPARERHQLGPGGAMPVVQGGSSQCGSSG